MEQKENTKGILNVQVGVALLGRMKSIAVAEGRTLRWLVQDALAKYVEGGGSHGTETRTNGPSENVVPGAAHPVNTREADQRQVSPRPFDGSKRGRYETEGTDVEWAGVARDRETSQWFLVIRGKGTEYVDRETCLRMLEGMRG